MQHRVRCGRQVRQLWVSRDGRGRCCGWGAQVSGPRSGLSISTAASSDTVILVSGFFSHSVNARGPANTQEKEANGPACCLQLPGHRQQTGQHHLKQTWVGVGDTLCTV